MKTPRFLFIAPAFVILMTAACSAAGPVTPTVTGETATLAAAATQPPPAPSFTSTPEPTHTATPEPSPTATPATLPLEIVEWSEYPYANPADPQNTDTHVEILVHNPNEFAVRVDQNAVMLNFRDAAGEVVYSNPNPTFYIWEGVWILGGETVPLSACVCFQTSGLEKQAWVSLDMTVPLQPAPGFAYTAEVEVDMGEFFSLAEAHLGGDSLAAEMTLRNTSDQVLESFGLRVTARDAGGKYVGVAIYGTVVDRDEYGETIKIEPGMSGGGMIPSEIDYVSTPLQYEVTAIGILPGN